MSNGEGMRTTDAQPILTVEQEVYALLSLERFGKNVGLLI